MFFVSVVLCMGREQIMKTGRTRSEENDEDNHLDSGALEGGGLKHFRTRKAHLDFRRRRRPRMGRAGHLNNSRKIYNGPAGFCLLFRVRIGSSSRPPRARAAFFVSILAQSLRYT